jgi:hypothetical protein
VDFDIQVGIPFLNKKEEYAPTKMHMESLEMKPCYFTLSPVTGRFLEKT